MIKLSIAIILCIAIPYVLRAITRALQKTKLQIATEIIRMVLIFFAFVFGAIFIHKIPFFYSYCPNCEEVHYRGPIALLLMVLYVLIGNILFVTYCMDKSTFLHKYISYVEFDKNFLPLSMFLSYYKIAPDNWDFGLDNMRVRHRKEGPCRPDTRYSEFFYFTLYDYMKICKYSKNKDKRKRDEQNNEDFKDLLERVQEDIHALKKQSEDEKKEAVNRLKNIPAFQEYCPDIKLDFQEPPSYKDFSPLSNNNVMKPRVVQYTIKKEDGNYYTFALGDDGNYHAIQH